MKVSLRRSWLYVPAHQGGWYPKLKSYHADVIVFDFEDGVPFALKDEGRAAFLEGFQKYGRFSSAELFVRVSPLSSPHFEKDLKIIKKIIPQLTGIVLPKVESTRDVLKLNKRLLGTKVEIMPTLEILKGEQNAYSILQASKRIKCAQFGESGDYTLDFGIFNREMDAMADPVAADFALNMIKASKAAKKSLIDGAHLDIKNLKSLKMRCEWAFKMGFDGKAAMHPNQIPLINKEMMPSTQAIKEAEKMVEVYEKGSEVSSFVPHQNGFITPPKYRAAKLFLKKWREK